MIHLAPVQELIRRNAVPSLRKQQRHWYSPSVKSWTPIKSLHCLTNNITPNLLSLALWISNKSKEENILTIIFKRDIPTEKKYSVLPPINEILQARAGYLCEEVEDHGSDKWRLWHKPTCPGIRPRVRTGFPLSWDMNRSKDHLTQRSVVPERN